MIRETLARRMPHPPDEFVAIQVSRLDEALLIAFGAMSPGNLKPVDPVVTIVRELDRYGGAFAAEWARPAAPRRDAPIEGAYGAAWICSAEPALQAFETAALCAFVPPDLAPPDLAASDLVPIRRPGAWLSKDASSRVNLAAGRRDRPENLAQQIEKIDSAPETPAAAMASADLAAHETVARDATDGVARPPAGHGFPATGSSAEVARKISRKLLKRLESAPGPGRAATAGADAGPSANVAARWSGFSGEAQCVAAQPEGQGLAVSAPADARPKNPAQVTEKIESAPGLARAATAGADAGPSANVAARWSGFSGEAQCVAAQPEGQGLAVSAPADARPKNPAQRFEKVESTPGRGSVRGRLLASAAAPGWIGSGSVRATLVGAMACWPRATAGKAVAARCGRTQPMSPVPLA